MKIKKKNKFKTHNHIVNAIYIARPSYWQRKYSQKNQIHYNYMLSINKQSTYKSMY